jgi:hypothetical protein
MEANIYLFQAPAKFLFHHNLIFRSGIQDALSAWLSGISFTCSAYPASWLVAKLNAITMASANPGACLIYSRNVLPQGFSFLLAIKADLCRPEYG